MCIYVCVYMCVSRSKNGGSPTARQIGAPDLCLSPFHLLLPLGPTIIPLLLTCTDRWRFLCGLFDLCCTVVLMWD